MVSPLRAMLEEHDPYLVTVIDDCRAVFGLTMKEDQIHVVVNGVEFGDPWITEAISKAVPYDFDLPCQPPKRKGKR